MFVCLFVCFILVYSLIKTIEGRITQRELERDPSTRSGLRPRFINAVAPNHEGILIFGAFKFTGEVMWQLGKMGENGSVTRVK